MQGVDVHDFYNLSSKFISENYNIHEIMYPKFPEIFQSAVGLKA